jgi:hypothetical protein
MPVKTLAKMRLRIQPMTARRTRSPSAAISRRKALLAMGLGGASLLGPTLPAWAEGAVKAISPKDGPIKLFNGRDLTGFTTWLQDAKKEDPRKVFGVTDGMIHITGDGFGGLLTEKEYAEYRLVCEFRWGERTWGTRKKAARDSGVLVHGTGPEGGYSGIWQASIEAQIIEGGVGDVLVVPGKDESGKPIAVSAKAEVTHDRDGESVWKAGAEVKSFTSGRINWFGRDPDWKDELGFRGKDDVEKPFGEWNRLEVICAGARVTNIVNGVTVCEVFDVTPTAGRISIQTEGAELFVRTFELHPLKK